MLSFHSNWRTTFLKKPISINYLFAFINHNDHLGEATNLDARFEEVRRKGCGYEQSGSRCTRVYGRLCGSLSGREETRLTRRLGQLRFTSRGREQGSRAERDGESQQTQPWKHNRFFRIKKKKKSHDTMKSLFDAETDLEMLFRKVHNKNGWQCSLRSNDQLLLHLLGIEMNLRTTGRVPLPL